MYCKARNIRQDADTQNYIDAVNRCMEQRGFVFNGPDGDAELSIDQVRALAQQGDPDGLYALGMAYLFGWDIEQDEGLGYEYLEKAVDAGQTEAMTLLVRMFFQGEYDGIDSVRAAKYSMIAARDGIPDAQLYAGLAYMDGVSVKQDYREAARLFRLSANQGNSEARTNLAYLYQEGLGVDRDEGKAFRLYRTAARAGNVNAMFHLGICHEFGVGTGVDLEAARDMYVKASEQGDAFAMERLGYLYSETSGSAFADAGQSFEWFLRSAMEGVPTAMFMVGYCYLNSIGTEFSLDEARKWLRMASSNGIEDADRLLDEIGTGSEGQVQLR